VSEPVYIPRRSPDEVYGFTWRRFLRAWLVAIAMLVAGFAVLAALIWLCSWSPEAFVVFAILVATGLYAYMWVS
jgi:hypothetical protein